MFRNEHEMKFASKKKKKRKTRAKLVAEQQVRLPLMTKVKLEVHLRSRVL